MRNCTPGNVRNPASEHSEKESCCEVVTCSTAENEDSKRDNILEIFTPKVSTWFDSWWKDSKSVAIMQLAHFHGQFFIKYGKILGVTRQSASLHFLPARETRRIEFSMIDANESNWCNVSYTHVISCPAFTEAIWPGSKSGTFLNCVARNRGRWYYTYDRLSAEFLTFTANKQSLYSFYVSETNFCLCRGLSWTG